MTIASVNSSASTSLISSPNFYEGAVTPDALFIYLSTRLQRLDADIDGVFSKQQDAEQVRKALGAIKRELATLAYSDKEQNKAFQMQDPTALRVSIDAQLEAIDAVNPQLATELRASLHGTTGIFSYADAQYNTLELNASRETIDQYSKDLEATSQLDMIQLQSLMSARQTAIQLSTNLTASLADSLKSIVGNMGR
jgi:hypothetical protein